MVAPYKGKMIGEVFGRLTVLRKSPNKSGKKVRWVCKCQCGATKTIQGTHLRYGVSRSCGCLRIEELRDRSITHGLSHTRSYGIWTLMMKRCYDKSFRPYDGYGARGITVCDRWHVFKNFYEDMGEAPEKLEIDRINNNGNYEPGNCRWVTHQQNCLNTRRQERALLRKTG